MVINTLMIKLKERENCAQIKTALLSMKGKIKELRDLQVEVDIRHGSVSYDILLITHFSSMEDMKTYLTHPVHVEVSKYIAGEAEASTAVCYEE